jgi:hypothetical protein
MQSIQTVSYPNRMGNVTILSPCGLKNLNLLAEYEAVAIKNASHGVE